MLEGITVLDLASVGPAARASRWLADYGADVVKIAPVPKDTEVQIKPPFHSYSGGRGMRRVELDLKSPEGRNAFLALASSADAIIESFRPGVMDRLGVGYDDVVAVNPAIVYCSTTGYGQTGSRAGWAGHDLNYLAAGGFLAASTPGEGGKPPIPGATVADSAGGGMHAVMSILAALVHRQHTGEGTRLDVSVVDGLTALMALSIDEHLATGAPQGPGSGLLTGRYACYDLYEAADHKWVSVAAIERRFWANLCEALGLERWIEYQHDDAAQEEIRADLRAAFATKERDAWTAELAPKDTCVAPVLTVEEVAANAEVIDAVHPDHGRYQQLAPTLAGSVRPAEPVELPA